MVTALEVSSASSPALDSRASEKKRKMESKLFQEVSSCRSVPACETMETETASEAKDEEGCSHRSVFKPSTRGQCHKLASGKMVQLLSMPSIKHLENQAESSEVAT